MRTPTLPALSAALIGSLALAGPVAAQQGTSGVWIGQVSNAVPVTSPRYTNPSAVDQVLQSYTTPTQDSGPTLMVPSSVAQSAASGAPGGGSTVNNLAILNQYGTGNTGTITQSGGTGNSATATVYGNGNGTTQTQTGSGNSSNILLGTSGAGVVGSSATTLQDGNGNTSSLAVTGNGITVNTTQVGSGLSYSGSFDSTSDKTITVVQRGIGSGAAAAAAALPASNGTVIPIVTRR